jgi:hypothetical protein
MHANDRRSQSGTASRPAPSPTSGSARFHQAKDVLTDWFGVSPEQAENLLLTWSCETRTSACEVATALMSDIVQGRPTGCRADVLRHLEQRLRDLSNGNLVHEPFHGDS